MYSTLACVYVCGCAYYSVQYIGVAYAGVCKGHWGGGHSYEGRKLCNTLACTHYQQEAWKEVLGGLSQISRRYGGVLRWGTTRIVSGLSHTP